VKAAAAAAHLRERQRLVVVVVVLKSAAAAAASSATAATGLVNATTFSACFSLRGGGCVCVCGQTTPLNLSACGRPATKVLWLSRQSHTDTLCMPLLLLYAAVVVGMRRYCWLAGCRRRQHPAVAKLRQQQLLQL